MGFWARLLLTLLIAAPTVAQQRLSTQAGMINYAEGIFYLDQEQLQFPAARFREMGKGQSLQTGQGWVEVQLGPNAFLWMGEGGLLQMQDPSPTNVELLVKRGLVLIEIYTCDEQTKNNRIRIRSGNAVIELAKEGLYRFDSERSHFSVYRGKATVQLAANRTAVKSGKAVILTDSLTVSKFDTKQTDQLYANAARRSQQLLPKELMEARARQQQIAEAQFERQQQQSMDATQRRLQLEQRQRDAEARRERNRTRDPNSREEYDQPTWPKPPWAK